MLLVGCFVASGVQASDQAAQWVRVQDRAAGAESRIESPEIRERLSDYGSFRWGQLQPEQIEALRRSGLEVVVEQDPFELSLGGRSFDPLQAPPALASRAADPRGDFHLVQFDGPIRSAWLRALRAQGVELVQPLHPFSYIVWAPSEPMSAARGMPHVRWSGLMRSEWKLTPAQRFTQAGLRPTMALASAHVDIDQLREQLAKFGQVHSVTSFSRHYRLVHMDADGRDYSSIADIPSIMTVQYIPDEAGPRGEMSNQSVVGAIDGTGQVQPGYTSWLNDTGFDGSGITVGVVDGRVLTTHVDLADRIKPCTGTNGSCASAPDDDHGTHVAGAIAGTGATGSIDSNGFLRGQGVAPGASIVTQVYDPFLDASSDRMLPDGMLQIYQDSVNSGALLTNNSWGPTGSPQGYDIPTQQIDFISRDADPDTPGNQPVLAVWSIMNGSGDSEGNCAPSSLGSPDEAKNLFAVGSTSLRFSNGTQRSDIFSVSANSAHGPACDGRRVPHIVAPGCLTDSADNADDSAHTLMCGTSMASPIVSGSIAVWAERHIAETGVNPSPALAKAAFTAAARNLEGNTNADGQLMGHRPDRFQGFGRLDLDSIVNPSGGVLLYDQEHIFDDTGQNWSLEILADQTGEPVRLMLAWTDAPGHGLGGNTPAWVNNLDLQVDSGGHTYLGNAIGADGWSAGGGIADPMNNLEGVFLSPEQIGGVTAIRVIAAELKGDALDPYDPGDPRQDFALACLNCETYTVKSQPASLAACIPPAGSVEHELLVDLETTGDYGGDVALGSTGLPTGVTGSFTPASVSLPGTSNWTLNIAASAEPGSFFVSIDGDDGTLANSDRLELDLRATLSAATLVSPSQGQNVNQLRPTFIWDELAQANSYRIQVARDSSFGDIVIDESLTTASFTPSSDLEFGEGYFWRVRGVNDCGSGEWSQTRSLMTRMFKDRFEDVSSG